MTSKLALVAVALGLVTLPLFAADGLLIVQKTTIGPNSQTTQVQMEKDRMRAETTAVNGEKQVVIFDGQQLTTINVDRKTYTVITKAEADRMGAAAADPMAAMRAQLASMPPEQRAQIEAMMQSRMAALA